MKVEKDNPKFNFLRYADDPYRPYYQQKLDEQSGGAAEKNQAAANTATTVAAGTSVDANGAQINGDAAHQEGLEQQ